MKYRSRMGMRPGRFGILMTRELIDEAIYSEKGNEALLINPDLALKRIRTPDPDN
jgi:hypothetical protein